MRPWGSNRSVDGLRWRELVLNTIDGRPLIEGCTWKVLSQSWGSNRSVGNLRWRELVLIAIGESPKNARKLLGLLASGEKERESKILVN